jgi:NitT/TauT family transport system substrate-binding protein
MGYAVNTLRVTDYVQLVSNGLITNEATIANNPDLVRRMVQATLRGLATTLENPNEAYLICNKFVEGLDQANQDVQKEVLRSSLEFWKADKPGFSELKAWENMQKVLLDMGMLTAPLDLSQAYTNQFVGGGK